MFFLGLLSTPLPYLLLAAFYFFGFAMGMFNNNSGEETVETVAPVTIHAETKPQTAEPAIYYFQANNYDVLQYNSELADIKNTALFYPPDQRQSRWLIKDAVQYDFRFSGFLFSRPPPSVC